MIASQWCGYGHETFIVLLVSFFVSCNDMYVCRALWSGSSPSFNEGAQRERGTWKGEFLHITLFWHVPPCVCWKFNNADSYEQLSAKLYNIYHCCVYSEKTPDDGQRNCPKHVEFYSKNKFEKLCI